MRVPTISHAGKVVLALGLLLAVLAATGFLNAQRDVEVTSEQAIDIASSQVDFEPEQTAVRLIRQGIGGAPVWAVSLSIPGAAGGYDELTTVEVDARSGDVLNVRDG
jgi:hypothetical protein